MSLTRLMSWPSPLLVEPGSRVVLGQYALERGIVALDGGHRVVHGLADGRLGRAGLEVGPARLLRDPEDVRGPVLVGVLGVSALGSLGIELRVLGLERVGDVLEGDQPQDDVLVLRRVHVVAEGIGGLPELGLEAQVGGGVGIAGTSRGSLPSPHGPPRRRLTCLRDRIGQSRTD